eukprot:753036-Hanusia_phi.AAC.3
MPTTNKLLRPWSCPPLLTSTCRQRSRWRPSRTTSKTGSERRLIADYRPLFCSDSLVSSATWRRSRAQRQP